MKEKIKLKCAYTIPSKILMQFLNLGWVITTQSKYKNEIELVLEIEI